MDVLLNFARISDAQAAHLARAVREAGHRVVAVASHRGEPTDRLGSGIAVERWHDYSNGVGALPWRDDGGLEEALGDEGLLRLLAVVERPAPRVGGIAEALWRANCDMARARSLIDRSGADALISLDDPESGLDVCLEALARRAGLRRLWIRRGLTGFERCAGSDPYEPIIGGDGAISPAMLPIRQPAPPSAAPGRSAIAAMVAGGDPEVLPRSERERVPAAPALDMAERLLRRSSRFNTAMKHRPLVSGPAFLRRLRRELSDHARAVTPGTPVCLLALHYQPELSTLTMGGWGTRQLEVARFLAEHLPEGWRLAVQEHPSTFWAGSRTSATFRPPGFYARVAALPRTTLLPPPDAPRPPPPGTALVVTASGTMGAESLARGIPVIHLGRAAYANFRGTGWLRRPDPACFRALLDGVLALDPSEVRDGFAAGASLVASVSFAPPADDPIQGMVAAAVHAIPLWSGLP